MGTRNHGAKRAANGIHGRMKLNQRLYEVFRERAEQNTIEQVCIGLAYTAVAVSGGGGGIAYTWTESGQSFVGPDTYRNVEGESARSLLGDIRSESPLKRSMALALINALNADSVQDMSIDPDNTVMFRKLGIRKGARVAMVGYFPPLAKRIESVGAELEILDQGKKIGDKHRFYQKIDDWAEALILTASSILNNTTESVIKAIGPSVKTAIVGPSTPMAPEAFHHLPVQLLAGSVIEDREAVFRAIRHGAGTPVIGRFCRKIYTHVQ